MRVAALYDIHGNLPALEAVLAEVEREGVDAIVVGGDIAAGPPQPREVVELVRSLPNAHVIRGNADRLFADEYTGDDGLDWLLERLVRRPGELARRSVRSRSCSTTRSTSMRRRTTTGRSSPS